MAFVQQSKGNAMTEDAGDWLDDARLETRAIRAGIHRSSEGEHAEPIFTTSSYIFDSAADAAARYEGTRNANVYSRYTNPTVRSFEQRLATMEGAEAAVGTSSGMAAILSVCMAFLKAGDHVVCSLDIFGSTVSLFENYISKLGVEVSFVALCDLDAWESAIRSNTCLLFCETPSNPLCKIVDLSALASLANKVGARLVVDNCFCTPVFQRPLELGAHIVIHSATKYIDGQGRVLGGAVVGNATDMTDIIGFVRTCGPSMSPFNAWVALKGLETLSLRMVAHSNNAQALAEWLQVKPGVLKVNYAGLPEHSGHALAAKQQSGFGGVLSFELAGDRDTAWSFLNATQMMSLTANLGDAKTTIVHPATTTHSRLSAEQQANAGVTDGLIRIAVGLEHIEDIKADCERGFAAISGCRGT